MFAALPYIIGEKYLENPFKEGFTYLLNHLCAYQSINNVQTQIAQQQGTCSDTIDIRGTGPYSFTITFNALKWIQASENVVMKISLSTPLNYLKIPLEEDATLVINNTDSNLTDVVENETVIDSTTGSRRLLQEDFKTEPKSSASVETEHIKVTNEPQII